MMINAAALAAISRSLNAAFSLGLADAKPNWERIAERIGSANSQNDYAWLGQFPQLRKWVGERHVKNLSVHTYTVTNEKYEATISIPREKIEDDQYGTYANVSRGHGRAAAMLPANLVFALLAAGHTEKCYDGQYFFDTDHPVGDGEAAASSVSNYETGSGALWALLDTKQVIKPLIFQERTAPEFNALVNPNDENVFMRDEYLYGVRARGAAGFGFWQTAFGSKQTLDATAFNANRAAMMAFKGDDGKPLGIMPDLLVVGPSNEAAAEAIVKVVNLANGGSNPNYNKVELLVSPWMS